MAELEIKNTDELNDKLNELTKDASLNKPSEEEIEAAKLEYEEAAKAWNSTFYKIGEPEQAQEYCDYIKQFIKNRFLWQKEAWMGVIKLTDELEAAEKIFNSKKDKSLELGYQALEFTYYALSNPGGVGLKAAKDFESEVETFAKVATEVENELQNARKNLKNVEFLQQKWGAMAQGFYLEEEPIESEEQIPTNVEEENSKNEDKE